MALFECIECGARISDKAISCPHCGMPYKITEQNIESVKSANMSVKREHRRLPNGFGQIRKQSGQRRKPYVAYPSITKDMLDDWGKAHVKPLGYFETWYDAYDYLVEYNKGEHKGILFSEIYDKWIDYKFGAVGKTYSASTEKAYRMVKNNLTEVWNKSFASLRAEDLQEVIDNRIDMSISTLNMIKITFNQMYQYAISQGIVEKDYSQYVTTKSSDIEKGEPITEEEIKSLWEHKSDKNVAIALILLYSGLRITELKQTKIDLKNRLFIGGIKTDAGKNRTVPIHSAIIDLVKEFDQYDYKPTSYTKYHFDKVKSICDISTSNSGKNHTPHDLRHTFSWLCDKYGVDSVAKKMLMGHSFGSDITNGVYGHRTDEELRTEIEKIKV